jgi:hypothetical protein
MRKLILLTSPLPIALSMLLTTPANATPQPSLTSPSSCPSGQWVPNVKRTRYTWKTCKLYHDTMRGWVCSCDYRGTS